MIVLIPLGGLGLRFKNNGYQKPKALIKLYGKNILRHLIDNLNLSEVKYVYISYNIEYAKYRFEEYLTKTYPNISFKFLKLDKLTEGAAETIHISLKHIENDCDDSILCLDGDNFYTTDIIKQWNGKNKVFTIHDTTNTNIYSFVKLEQNSGNTNILDIIEKEKISDYACTGAYGFSSFKTLLKYTQKILTNKIKQKNEYYTSTVIREMIRDNIKFDNSVVEKKDWHCIGTPIQLRQFYLNNLDKQNQTLRLCFDLDNTLVSFPKINNDYTSVEPIVENIEFLRYVKSLGHTIIIHTARRMRTHGGNVGKILADVGKITFDTLTKFDIPFDEIYFGKPEADIYIDDLALNCFDDLEKELGFYRDTILPRDFNRLQNDGIGTFTKSSSDLSGEIYYYNNIPSNIKHYFPALINFDINNKWYTMEKINGLAITTLYLSELLTPDILKQIMNSINCIQKTPFYYKGHLNIYENYCSKLKNRYESFDYTQFDNSEYIYELLYQALYKYEADHKGRLTMIHGDAVFTNILLDNSNNLKFIDMRGKLGSDLTIYGDWLYDWAKMYQSLIGYDRILQGKTISSDYEKHMINTFETYFIELFDRESLKNLKIITASLLFTLIPLHHNEKCIQYYKLIDTIYHT